MQICLHWAAVLIPNLTLLIPSYFGPTLYTKGGGGGGHLDPYLINSWLYKPQILQGITENTRFVKNLLHGYHGNCLITWCFSLIIVKTSTKNRYFANAPRNYKLEGVKIKLCVMIVLFSKCFVILIEIHEKVRHVGTICRVAIVNLTDQIGLKSRNVGENWYKHKENDSVFHFLVCK